MKILWTVVLLLGISLMTKGDVAVAPGSIRVQNVFDSANLVCSCLVESLDDQKSATETAGKPSTHHEVTATVAIQDVYKSDDPGVKKVFIRYAQDEQQGQTVGGSRLRLSKSQNVLLFLTKTGTDTYEFADPFLGATQFSSLPIASGDQGLLKLQRVLSAVVQQAPGIEQLRALQILQGFDHIADDTLSVVRPLSESSDPDIALTALGVFLKTKSTDSVLTLKRYFDSHRSDTQRVALFVIGPELSEITNPKALPALEALSTSKFLPIQFGAMDAIRRIRNVNSTPTLIQRLDDSNSTVRYVAVITLAEIYGKYEGDYAPSMYLFDKKPQYYTALWKTWWVERGGKP